MSIQAAWNFNENSITNVLDYSGNGLDSASVANLTTIAATTGYAGVFNGSSTKVNFGNILDLGGDDKLDIFCRVLRASSQANPILYKAGHFDLSINASDKVVFKATIGAAEQTLTSTTSIVVDTYTTIGATYDGTNMVIYIDGTSDVTQAQTGNLVASTSTAYIGTDTSTFFDGRIESVDVYNTGLTSDNITALDANPTGLKYTFTRLHNLELGDLISKDQYSISPVNMIVTFKESNYIIRAKPISGGRLNLGDVPIRRGNISDTSRQWIAELRVDSDEPRFKISDNLTNFGGASNENKEVIRLDRVEASREGRDFLRYALMI